MVGKVLTFINSQFGADTIIAALGYFPFVLDLEWTIYKNNAIKIILVTIVLRHLIKFLYDRYKSSKQVAER